MCLTLSLSHAHESKMSQHGKHRRAVQTHISCDAVIPFKDSIQVHFIPYTFALAKVCIIVSVSISVVNMQGIPTRTAVPKKCVMTLKTRTSFLAQAMPCTCAAARLQNRPCQKCVRFPHSWRLERERNAVLTIMLYGPTARIFVAADGDGDRAPPP